MMDLQGLILLVNGCTTPSCLPFKQWVADVILAVQRRGSHELRASDSAGFTPGQSSSNPQERVTADRLVDVIVRLEQQNDRFHTEVMASLRRAEHAWSRIADAL